jgi:hypothetical protein
MLPWVGLALVGYLAGRRNRPKTKYKRREMLGSHSGLPYEIEEFPEADLLMVSRKGCLRAVVKRSTDGLEVLKAQGTSEAMKAFRSDFIKKEAEQ